MSAPIMNPVDDAVYLFHMYKAINEHEQTRAHMIIKEMNMCKRKSILYYENDSVRACHDFIRVGK